MQQQNFTDYKSEHTDELEQIAKELSLYPVDAGTRFLHFIVDLIAQFVVGIAIGTVLVVLAELVNPNIYYFLDNMNFVQEYLFNFIIGFSYFVVLESTTSQTIGKMLTKTKVVTENGEKPDFKTILIRSLCRYIPFEAFSFLGSKPTGWHDTISKTMVIKISA